MLSTEIKLPTVNVRQIEKRLASSLPFLPPHNYIMNDYYMFLNIKIELLY